MFKRQTMFFIKKKLFYFFIDKLLKKKQLNSNIIIGLNQAEKNKNNSEWNKKFLE